MKASVNALCAAVWLGFAAIGCAAEQRWYDCGLETSGQEFITIDRIRAESARRAEAQTEADYDDGGYECRPASGLRQ